MQYNFLLLRFGWVLPPFHPVSVIWGHPRSPLRSGDFMLLSKANTSLSPNLEFSNYRPSTDALTPKNWSNELSAFSYSRLILDFGSKTIFMPFIYVGITGYFAHICVTIIIFGAISRTNVDVDFFSWGKRYSKNTLGSVLSEQRILNISLSSVYLVSFQSIIRASYWLFHWPSEHTRSQQIFY